MSAGQFTQRVTVEGVTHVQDDYGGITDAWTPRFTVWAAVEPLAGREYVASMVWQSEVTVKICLRFHPSITSLDRILHEGTVYKIVSVIDYKSQHRNLVLMCKT